MYSALGVPLPLRYLRPMSGAALHVDQVSHRWSGAARAALIEASLSLCEGEFVGILGANGAGKSTLLRVAAGLLPANEGTVRIGDVSLAGLSARDRARSIAYLPQREVIPSRLSVREYVSLGRGPWTTWSGRLSAADLSAVASALARTGLDALEDRAVASLSGGEQRRCMTARALAQGARFALLDEPLASLDVHQQVEVGGILRTYASSGAGVLAVLHELNLAAQLCDRVIVLREGRLLVEGSPRLVLTRALVESVFPCAFIEVESPTGAPCFVPIARP